MVRYLRETPHDVMVTYMQRLDVVTQAALSQCEFDLTWLAADMTKMYAHGAFRAASDHVHFCANSDMTPTDTLKFLVLLIVGKRVLGQLFLTGTRDFGKVKCFKVLRKPEPAIFTCI